MAKLLDFILASRTEFYDDVERLARPDSFSTREEMNDHFEEVIGYVPDKYMNERSVEEYFNNALRRAPFSVQEQMIKKKSDIIDQTMSVLDDVDEVFIERVFCNVCQSIVGWDASDGAETIDSIIKMAVFNSDDFESEEEEDEDEEDFSDEEDEDSDEDDSDSEEDDYGFED